MAESQRHCARRFVTCVVNFSMNGAVGFKPGFLFRICLPAARLWERISTLVKRLALLEQISTLEKENKALENLHGSLTSENGLLKGRVSEQEETISKMQEKMSLDESVLENLRGVVEREMPRRLLTFKWRFASSKPMLRERMSRSQSLRRRLRSESYRVL